MSISRLLDTEFFIRLFIEVVLLGLVVFMIQKYFEYKLQPMTAAEVLKIENYFNSKREVYFNALNLINRNLAYSEWTGNGVPDARFGVNAGEPKPTEIEVNTCFSKMCLYTNDKNILTSFIGFFNGRTARPTTQLLAEFTDMIRQDLGYSKSLLDPTKDEYKYIRITQMPMDSSVFQNRK